MWLIGTSAFGMVMRKLALTKHLEVCTNEPKATRKQTSKATYLIEITEGLVAPYIRLLVKTVLLELPSHAPIKELSTREIEDSADAADMVLAITDNAGLSLASICRPFSRCS